MSESSFTERLRALWQRDAARLLCVGLDPEPNRFPEPLRHLPLDTAAKRFLQGIVEATAEWAVAFKPQIAHFAARGWESLLARLIAWIHRQYPQIPVILDAKRGDIGSTAAYYAEEAFARFDADAVTVNPYLGRDALVPYWERWPQRGLFVLCRTSNPSGDELQFLRLADGRMLFEHVAALATSAWNPHGQTGLVVGATYPQEVARVRALAPNAVLLVPGIGAQGGDIAATVRAGWGGAAFPGLLLNSSRAILYASAGADWQQAAARAAQEHAAAIRAAVAALMPGGEVAKP